MKKYILLLITTFALSYSADAAKSDWFFAEDHPQDPWQGDLSGGLRYEWTDDTHTAVKTASADWDGDLLTGSTPEWAQRPHPDGNEIVIPAEIKKNGQMVPVVEIGDFSFVGGYFQKLTIPSSVTKMGKGAFAYCSGIAVDKIDFGGITTISEYAFYGAKGGGDDQVTVFPDCITEIGEYAFSKSAVKNIDLNKVQTLGESAFKNCTELKNVDFGSLTEIGKKAFMGCTGLSSVTFPSTLKTIGESAFEGSQSLNYVSFAEGLEEIGESAFSGCTNLKGEERTEIDEQGNEIKTYALYIPASVTSIQASAFKGCTDISRLFFNDVENSKLTYIGKHAFENCTEIDEEIIFPLSIKEIDDYAFYNCASVDGLIFGANSNLQRIGDYSFFYTAQRNFWDMHLPAGLKSIGKSAFVLNNTAGTDRDHEDPSKFVSWTDLFVYAPVPPSVALDGEDKFFELSDNETGKLDALESFGVLDIDWLDNGAYFRDPRYWIYCWVCLHVPYGTLELYRNAPGWKNFQCIIEDLPAQGVPSTQDDEDHITREGLGVAVGYAFMIPGEKLSLTADILPRADAEAVLDQAKWDVVEYKHENDEGDSPVSIDAEGNVTAGSLDEKGNVIDSYFGQKIAIARMERKSQYYDGSTWVEVETTNVVGVVVVYVCPTVILAYELADNEKAEKPMKVAAPTSTTGDVAVTDLATYEHRVVYNSYPQVKIEAAAGYEIGETRHAEANENRSWNYDEVKNNDEYLVDDEKDKDDDYTIALSDPIVQNRVILLTIMPTADPDGPSIGTGVQDVQVSAKIRVQVAGNVVTVIGAEDSDVVTVTNIKGQTVSRSTDKTVVLDRGIFVINVADASLKIIVR